MSIRKQYDSDLEALKTALVEMGQNAAEAVENALEALCTADTAAAQKIVQGDDRINNMERDIEHRCMTLLLRQQPVASDLRKISAAMKMITDMERIGDQAEDIVDLIPKMSGSAEEGPLQKMASAAQTMVTEAVDAYVKQDLALAKKVMGDDDIVDAYFNQVKSDIIAMIAANPGDGEYALDLLMIAKYFERIGDHCTNIAEWVEFSLTGIREECQ